MIKIFLLEVRLTVTLTRAPSNNVKMESGQLSLHVERGSSRFHASHGLPDYLATNSGDPRSK